MIVQDIWKAGIDSIYMWINFKCNTLDWFVLACDPINTVNPDYLKPQHISDKIGLTGQADII